MRACFLLHMRQAVKFPSAVGSASGIPQRYGVTSIKRGRLTELTYTTAWPRVKCNVAADAWADDACSHAAWLQLLHW